MSIVLAFANFGRGNRANVSHSMLKVAGSLPAGAILATAEIGEGDSGYDDHALLRQAFGGWRMLHDTGREPVLISAPTSQRWTVVNSKRRRTMKGIKHQSPPRHLQEDVLERGTGNEIAVLTGHYPAGAKNGSRNPFVKARLTVGYMRMLAMHRAAIQRHRKAGRDVVYAMDVNWRHFPRLHRREVRLAQHGPDLIRAIPAKGRTVKRIDSDTIPMTIEPMHDCIWVEVEFADKEK